MEGAAVAEDQGIDIHTAPDVLHFSRAGTIKPFFQHIPVVKEQVADIGAGGFHDPSAQAIEFVAGERRAAVLHRDQSIPSVVDQRTALLVGGHVAVVIES